MSETDTRPYRVLARKYRPTSFAELIGQEAMVRTLTNAINSGRLAHAFVLTGVRGVGKTTTARIIARALDCIDGPTPTPCGVCEHCRAIAEDRHVDVLEMDAASRTGVDDIRELIEGVRYRPTSARYKIYIIDEVHMLSRNAFNALLKTLEEPPGHVKFVFATTEIRKVPVTVLSRCQRFDLRRIDTEVLARHFAGVAAREGAAVSEGALHLIARAADGSVRDGLSLLDQAISHGTGGVDEIRVREMLGIADRTQVFDLFEQIMKGEVAAALAAMEAQYAAGADPILVLEDLLELTHWLTRLKAVPEAASDPAQPEAERVRGKAMADGLGMAILARAWQMLLKGLSEARAAPSPLQAVEMVIVRLAYAADLPSPADAVKALQGSGGGSSTPLGSRPGTGGPGGAATARALPATAPVSAPQPGLEAARPEPRSFADVVALAETEKEMILHANLKNNLHLVRFEPGLIEFHPTEHTDSSLAPDLQKFLVRTTGRSWMVAVSSAPGAATLHQQEEAAVASVKAEASRHPLVKAVLETFPGATITEVRGITAAVPEGSDSDDFSEAPEAEDLP